MIAEIYARKSTEQNGVCDDEKSVTRQIEHARAYAARKDWLVDEDQVCVDDGVSGAEFTSKRPGFIRLMRRSVPSPALSIGFLDPQCRVAPELGASFTHHERPDKCCWTVEV